MWVAAARQEICSDPPLVAVGDHTGDALSEVLGGAPGWKNLTGRAYVITSEGETVQILDGQKPGGGFGGHVSLGPDFDQAGFPSM